MVETAVGGGRSWVHKDAARTYGAPAAAEDEPLKSPYEVKYTKLIIDGQFADAASGTVFLYA